MIGLFYRIAPLKFFLAGMLPGFRLFCGVAFSAFYSPETATGGDARAARIDIFESAPIPRRKKIPWLAFSSPLQNHLQMLNVGKILFPTRLGL
jgi:hypothetical protein